jgi:hypothetical protein
MIRAYVPNISWRKYSKVMRESTSNIGEMLIRNGKIIFWIPKRVCLGYGKVGHSRIG